jgi:hypothetical protein
MDDETITDNRGCEHCHETKEDVELRRDPYRWEVHGESVYLYLCRECWEKRKDEV